MNRSHVYCAVTSHGAALLDTRPGRGRWRFLDPIGTRLWADITAGTPQDTAVETLVSHWAGRGIDPAQVRTDLTALTQDLHRARLLCPAHRTQPRTPPQVRFPATAPSGLCTRLAAGTGLAAALVLLRCAPLRCTIAVTRAAAKLPGRPAVAAEADAVHASVRRAARAWPGRAACLEESLGTFLAAALTGRRTRWVLGASFLPHGAHAWIEADGSVIGQAPQDRVWPYVPVLEVEHSN
ncbi:lasso peptide biosynthesis B2 protein [Streptomyces sp. NPDC002476]|uniref:lasso peptide biosynthesis B2 protein n=1 Tax=Streptomyces sp. NPDC002476 TaxID=3364648 RepID=UPI0036A30C35